ncbi:hypothetical protein BH23DEI1_BH23DEI1_04830 [soil metagenome]
MDPYLRRIVSRLGSLDPIEVLASTPTALEVLVARLGDVGLDDSYAPGKWPARTIVAHLADTELGMAFRFRQAVTAPPDEAPHAAQPFDQDAWAARSTAADPSLAVDAFRALRAWNIALFTGFSLDDWSTDVFHPERGFESVDAMVRFLAGHDLNHLDQLAAIAGVS